jgi:hypothetical protein
MLVLMMMRKETKMENKTAEKKIGIFAIHNDSSQWAIIVDNRLGLYDDIPCEVDHVKKIWAAIGGASGEDGLANTPFGSAQLIPPHTRCEKCYHDEHDSISQHVADADYRRLEDYIITAWADWERKVTFGPLRDPLDTHCYFCGQDYGDERNFSEHLNVCPSPRAH